MIKYIYSGIKWGAGNERMITKLPDNALLDFIRDRGIYDSIEEVIQECLEWDGEDTEEVYITKLTIENNTIKLEPMTFKVTRKVSYSYEFEVTNDGIGSY